MKRLFLSTLILMALPVSAATNGIHPKIQLLDANAIPVTESLKPMSATETCTDCHDGEFIATNHDHPLHIATNCMICHSDNYSAENYFKTRESGQPKWAAFAGLAPSDLARYDESGWHWEIDALGAEGIFTAQELKVKSADSQSCGQCHGIVYSDQEPLVFDPNGQIGRLTRTEGAIYSGQKLSYSGLNLSGKDTTQRSFDVHAERLLECTDCHRAANNPMHGGARGESLSHLAHDPRLPDLSAFLERPDHNLVIGAAGGNGSCQGCHIPEDNHSWLEEVALHMDKVACQACHITELYGPAQQLHDDSVRNANGEPVVVWRSQSAVADINIGFKPLLLQRPEDGRFAPFNVSLTRYWRDAATNKSVPSEIVDQAWKNAGVSVSDASQYLTEEGLNQMAAALGSLGVEQPEIATIVETIAINHGVSRDSFALSDCNACHSDQGLLQGSLPLGPVHPGYVPPASLNTDGKPALILEQNSENQLHARSASTGEYELSSLSPLKISGLFGVLFGLIGFQSYKRSKR